MTADVVRGLWAPVEVTQTAIPAPGEWHRRDDHGHLWVWLRGSWRSTPVEPARVRGNKLSGLPSPQRISQALDLWGMSGPEVDEALGVADVFDTVVDAWEAGELEPAETEIRRLATLTGFAPAYFYRPDDLPWIINPSFCRGGHR